MNEPTDGGGQDSQKKTGGGGPKTRVCYICGRQYGLHSFEIHLRQCKELWIAREEKKDPKERKPLPADPLVSKQFEKGGTSDKVGLSAGIDLMDLSRINQIASEAFNSSALSRCEHCERTFLPEKLVIHQRSCTAENPARRITDGVRTGKDPVKSSVDSSTSVRMRTPSASIALKKRVSTNEVATNGEIGETNEQRRAIFQSESTNIDINTSFASLDSPPPMAGSFGGSAGRRIRSAHRDSIEKDRDRNRQLEVVVPFPKNILLAHFARKLNEIENVARGLLSAVEEMKIMLADFDESGDSIEQEQSGNRLATGTV